MQSDISRMCVYGITYRYSIILECWQEDPDERPTFSHLVSSISSQLESMAGYLDVNTVFINLHSANDEVNC